MVAIYVAATEGALLRTYQMSGGEFKFFLGRPIAMVLLALLAASVLLPLLRKMRTNRTAQGRR